MAPPRPARLAALLAAASIAGARPARAEPASCLLADPSAWPAVSKPYFMILVDTSGSMISQGPAPPAQPVPPSCPGYPATRMGHAKCAVKNAVLAFGGQVSFGLAQYATFMKGCGASCYGNASGVPSPACQLTCYDAEIASKGACYGCGPYDDPMNPATGHGATVLVGMQVDNFWSAPPSPSNVPQILKYVDDVCTGNFEVTSSPADGPAYGLTPINGALRDMRRYFQTGWTNPDHPAITLPTPLSPNDRPCRSVNVILLTDGDETCDSQLDAVNAAAALRSPGVTAFGHTFAIKTHVINFAGGNQASTNQLAAAGGTGSSFFATDEVGLSQALANIVSSAIQPETCDNIDNNCNGCTDEGFPHYCDVQPLAANCCAWATPAGRAGCLAGFVGSITPAIPKGNPALLPCTTPAQVQPATWLCYDPGERCDGVDNDCDGQIDEGILKCGSPPHCPLPEACNGVDDDCNGLIDDGPSVCPNQCAPSAEICDGCDNDCDGMADDGVAPLPCGLTGPEEPPNCQGQLVCKPAQAVPAGGCAPGGGFAPCSVSPEPEVCDGLDNDCNGITDDGVASIPCVPPGTPQSLVYGAPSRCEQGHTLCTSGVTSCTGFVGPIAELCNDVDDDCDGVVDESPPGVGMPCGVNQAPCAPGLTVCKGGLLVCEGGVPPKPEICNGLDDDCNGKIDDAPFADGPAPGQGGCWSEPGNCCAFAGLAWCPPPGASCNGSGALTAPCKAGTLVCTGAGGWICQGGKGPAEEECNGIDDDCDGAIDEEPLPKVGHTCGSDVGACVPGVIACTAGALVCAGGVGPSTEACDGIDNDCDGEIDEGIPSIGPCTAVYDALAYPGDRSAPPCAPGMLLCNGMGGLVCVGGMGPAPEVCNGIDDDCDGVIDEVGPAPDGIDGSANPYPPPEGKIGEVCGSSVGACEAGTYACVNALFACVGGQVAGPESCDCADEDCDGVIDNPNGPGGPPLCGMGNACVKSALGACQCASPCGDGEFPCPPGQHCEQVVSSQSGESLGVGYCVADADVDAGAETGTGAGAETGTGAGAGMGTGMGTGVGMNTSMGSGAGGESGASTGGFWGLATGGGGCSCGVGAGTGAARGSLGIALLALALRRRARGVLPVRA